MWRQIIQAIFVGCTAHPAVAATIRVPQDHKTIQAAIDAANTLSQSLRASIRNAFDSIPESPYAAPGVVTANTIKNFQGTAVVVRESQKPAHVPGNVATSTDAKARVVDVQGAPCRGRLESWKKSY